MQHPRQHDVFEIRYAQYLGFTGLLNPHFLRLRPLLRPRIAASDDTEPVEEGAGAKRSNDRFGRAPAQGDTCIFPDFFGIATGDRLFGSAARVGRGVAPILLYDVKLKTPVDGISRAPGASMQTAFIAECTQEWYIGADSRAAG